jgi:hypothetical protein
MKTAEMIAGVFLVLAGPACLRGYRQLSRWSFRIIWLVPADYDPPDWLRSVSNVIVVVVLLAMGGWLVVRAIV